MYLKKKNERVCIYNVGGGRGREGLAGGVKYSP